MSPSAHKIVSDSIGEEFQDVFAVLLKIAVDSNDQFAGRLPEARVERAGLAVVLVEVERGNSGAAPHAIPFPRGVAAAIATKMISNGRVCEPHVIHEVRAFNHGTDCIAHL